jgi:hypothetical protein
VLAVDLRKEVKSKENGNTFQAGWNRIPDTKDYTAEARKRTFYTSFTLN